LSAYGLSKWAAECYGQWFAEIHPLEVVSLRYGNVYGPRQEPRGDAGVVALFCDAALAGRPPVVFGDGLQTRDFVYVGDIARANLAAADAVRLPSAQYNVGSGVDISLLQLLDAVASGVGVDRRDWRPVVEPPRVGEVRHSRLDVSRADRELGLRTTTALADGVRHTVDWIRTSRLEAGPSRSVPTAPATAAVGPTV
jgi:UDP-glucose 4-epimerase